MEKKQKTSLTWQLILTMVVIVAGTVAMCWFFNTTFLEKYYIFHKEKELKSSFDQVRLICEKQGDSSDDAYVQFEKICANGNINMLIADQDRNLIWSSYSSAQRFQMQMEDWLYGSDRSRVQVLSSGKDYTLLRQTDERLQSEYLVLLGTLKNGNNLYMRAAVESIRESASITNQFFVMVSTGAIILSVILIIVLSKGISHPIHALSDIARRMTQLDFDAKYIPVRHVSREIDELGNSMNELSETLEETISELKTANVSLQQDIEKKEQIDEMRKEFLSNVSHELKTPMMAVQGCAEGINTGVLEPVEASRVILEENEQMSVLIEELLALSRLEAGQFKSDFHSTDVRELLYDCLRGTEHLAQQRNLRITPIFDDDPVTVSCDEIHLRRAFTNIITNALRYAKEEIIIECRQEKGKAVIRIRDDGEGIAPELLPHIFDRFFSTRKGGAGVGLALTKEIVSLHRGTVRASNDGGAVFEIILPIG